MIVTPKSSVAARNRFVYYPDHLVKMPGPGQDLYSVIWTLITEPVFEGLATSLLEFNRPQRATWSQYNNAEVDDESVASFLERRTGGPYIGNNIVSAVFHGIYAGDINQLSARSLMPQLWYDEALHGSYTQAMFKRFQEQSLTQSFNDAVLQGELQPKISQPLREILKDASVYTFKQGIGALAKALEKSLRANRNVEFKTGHAVKAIKDDAKSDTVSVRFLFCIWCKADISGYHHQKYASIEIRQSNINVLRQNSLQNRRSSHPGEHARCDSHGRQSLLHRP